MAADRFLVLGDAGLGERLKTRCAAGDAEQWRLAWLQVSTGGHCFGMAVASEGIWRDPVLTPGQFQAGAGQTFDLAKANARGFVMQNFLLQGTQPLTPANAPMSVTATGIA